MCYARSLGFACFAGLPIRTKSHIRRTGEMVDFPPSVLGCTDIELPSVSVHCVPADARRSLGRLPMSCYPLRVYERLIDCPGMYPGGDWVG